MKLVKSRYAVRACWRGATSSGEVLHRFTRDALAGVGCRGEPTKVWSVMRDGAVVADCYDKDDATRILALLRG
tara:strand:+ start:270 stop:488 length:219 start_codon:yes stop_codon:yes gene_type:complete